MRVELRLNESVVGEILTKISKEYELTFEFLTECVNKSFMSGESQGCLKQGNVFTYFQER